MVVSQQMGRECHHHEPGAGATFEGFLPVSEAIEYKKTPATGEKIFGGNESILVVDDEESLATIQQRSLERLGYRVTVCTESEAALAMLRAKPKGFDLLITDMTMPGLNGLQLAGEVKRLN